VSYWYPQAAVELRILFEDYKLTSAADTQKPYRLLVVTTNMTVNVNDYKTSDTFELEIDYKNFPFDPRTIRACGVVIYLQDMQRLQKDDGQPNTIVPGAATFLDSKIPNSIFTGFADEEEITFDDSKRMVKLTGRDITALLIDQKYLKNTPISLNQPIDTAILTLFKDFAATAMIRVVNKTVDANGNIIPLPTLAKFYPDFGSPMAGQKNVGRHENYWEIIQDIVARCGLICFMSRTILNDGTLVPTLIITTPKNQNVDTDDIKMIYGVNVKNLMLKRKLGRFKGFNVQVRSIYQKNVLIAKIPEQATQSWGTSYGFQYNPQLVSGPNVSGETQNFSPISVPVLKPDGSLDTSTTQLAPYITFNVPNVTDLDALIQIGQTFYEQYSLQQLEGSFETTEMLGRGGKKGSGIEQYNQAKQYDMTQIVKGQTICLELYPEDLKQISRLHSTQARTNYLISRGYELAVATVFATTLGKFSPRFQIKSYAISLNQDTGFSLKVNFQNVINLDNRGFT
jgi:hypothetical protein